MMDIIKLNSKFPVKMTINQFKKWYFENKDAVQKFSSKHINHRIIIVDDKDNEYKFIRRGEEVRIVPRERLESIQQIVDDVEQLKTLFKELEFMEEKLRHYGDLFVMKGIDIEENNDEHREGRQRQQSNFIKFGPV